MPASNTIVLKSLSVLLGLFFIFVGTLKLTPHISKDLYKDLVSAENQYRWSFSFPPSFVLFAAGRDACGISIFHSNLEVKTLILFSFFIFRGNSYVNGYALDGEI